MRRTSRSGLKTFSQQKPTRGEDDLNEDDLLAFAVAEQHAARREKAASGSVAAPDGLIVEPEALAANPDRAEQAEAPALTEDLRSGEDGLWAFEAWDKAEGGEPL